MNDNILKILEEMAEEREEKNKNRKDRNAGEKEKDNN